MNKIKQFFSSSSNRVMVMLFILLIVVLYNSVRLEDKNNELIEEKEANCYITNLDNNGDGFSYPVVANCKALRNNCETSNHNLPCIWEDIEGKTGCLCEFWR